VKLFQNQLELKSKLSSSLDEKDRVIKQFKETTIVVKNEIISQYKVKFKFVIL